MVVEVLWGCLGWVLGVYGCFCAKIVFLALLEAFGRAFWGRSGPSEHWKIDFCRVCRGFVGGLRGVVGVFWGCFGLVLSM